MSQTHIDFVFSEEPFPVLTDERGSGKTEAALTRAFKLALENPRGLVGFFVADYSCLNGGFWLKVKAEARASGLPGKISRAESTFTFDNGRGCILFPEVNRWTKWGHFRFTDAVIDDFNGDRDLLAVIANRCRGTKAPGVLNTCATVATPSTD
jgi:hypothetical protein